MQGWRVNLFLIKRKVFYPSVSKENLLSEVTYVYWIVGRKMTKKFQNSLRTKVVVGNFWSLYLDKNLISQLVMLVRTRYYTVHWIHFFSTVQPNKQCVYVANPLWTSKCCCCCGTRTIMAPFIILASTLGQTLLVLNSCCKMEPCVNFRYPFNFFI